MRKRLVHGYQDIISYENLLLGWKQFLRGKKNKKDVQEFQYCLGDNILSLHLDLKQKTYTHGGYRAFNISDPKPRNIHKATVRDRLLHHAIYRMLYPFFDPTFIADSYSCRLRKGTHRAMNRFKAFDYKASNNTTKTVWVLKCDIKKFFASIDHAILYAIFETYIPDQDILWLLSRVVGSFETNKGKGLPLGNLTSQLLVNVYMNLFDQFVKHTLKAKYYIRYADDFVLMSADKKELEVCLSHIEVFLRERLDLELHPDKVFMKTLASGVDFLGWVHFPTHRVLRTATKKKMFRGITKNGGRSETLESYKGLLSHGNAYTLKRRLGLT